jgi:UDP-N-acetylmuramyl pentapeptide phosphotransferase/UDP-N-acetylglucosamine-1-phosphate transferase
MKASLVLGFLLIFLGVGTLAYFASPVRMLVQQSVPQSRINMGVPIAGGLSLVFGIAILFVTRTRKR